METEQQQFKQDLAERQRQNMAEESFRQSQLGLQQQQFGLAQSQFKAAEEAQKEARRLNQIKENVQFLKEGGTILRAFGAPQTAVMSGAAPVRQQMMDAGLLGPPELQGVDLGEMAIPGSPGYRLSVQKPEDLVREQRQKFMQPAGAEMPVYTSVPGELLGLAKDQEAFLPTKYGEEYQKKLAERAKLKTMTPEQRNEITSAFEGSPFVQLLIPKVGDQYDPEKLEKNIFDLQKTVTPRTDEEKAYDVLVKDLEAKGVKNAKFEAWRQMQQAKTAGSKADYGTNFVTPEGTVVRVLPGEKIPEGGKTVSQLGKTDKDQDEVNRLLSAQDFASSYISGKEFTGPSDEALMEAYFEAVKPSRGFRQNQTQLKLTQNLGSWADKAKRFAMNARYGVLFSPNTRQDIVNAMNDAIKSKLKYLQQPESSGEEDAVSALRSHKSAKEGPK